VLVVNNDIFHVVLFITSATVAPPSLLCLSRAWRGVAKTKFCHRNRITKKVLQELFCVGPSAGCMVFMLAGFHVPRKQSGRVTRRGKERVQQSSRYSASGETQNDS
jgi:hypothetical protein